MSEKKLFSFLIFGILAFGIDIITPIGTGTWWLYVILLVLYVKVAGSYKILLLSSIYTLFLFLGYYFSPSNLSPVIAFINRIAAVILLLFIVYLALREGKVKKFNSEILDRISDSILAFDPKRKITYISSALLKNSSFKGNPVGKNIYEVFPQLIGSVFEQNFNESMTTQQPVSFLADGLMSDSQLEVYAYPSKEGMTIFARDISDKLSKEKELQKLLQKQEMLIKEIHHRVKNNFQLISSLIRLSARDISDENTAQVLLEVEARINTLALIHEKLYKSTNNSKIDLKSYLEELFDQLSSVAKYPAKNVRHIIEIDDVDVDIDTAISIGLIVNELYSNSLKHAFIHKETGVVGFSICWFADDPSKLQLIYKDNGIGLNGNHNYLDSGSLGMEIVHSYVEQSNGTIIAKDNDKGVEFNIMLSINN